MAAPTPEVPNHFALAAFTRAVDAGLDAFGSARHPNRDALAAWL